MLFVVVEDDVVAVECLKFLAQIWSDFAEGPNG